MSELTDEQEQAVERLRRVLADFALSLEECIDAGLKPVDAFRECGIDVPVWAGPLVNSMLARN